MTINTSRISRARALEMAEEAQRTLVLREVELLREREQTAQLREALRVTKELAIAQARSIGDQHHNLPILVAFWNIRDRAAIALGEVNAPPPEESS